MPPSPRRLSGLLEQTDEPQSGLGSLWHINANLSRRGYPGRYAPDNKMVHTKVALTSLVLLAAIVAKAYAQTPSPPYVVLDINWRIVDPEMLARLGWDADDPVRRLLIVSERYVLQLSRVGESDSMKLELLERATDVRHSGELNSNGCFRLVNRGKAIGTTFTLDTIPNNVSIAFLEQPSEMKDKRQVLIDRFRLLREAKFMTDYELNSLTAAAKTVRLFDKDVNIEQLCQTVINSELKLSWIEKILRNK